ncbi:hypothetical protein [Streptomyces sp. NPDC023588]|uniref:hypothetical protein n=1 Tax=Streptomyces sp. NPDC023588 TaxID=3154907 RepID=UPI0033D8B75F
MQILKRAAVVLLALAVPAACCAGVWVAASAMIGCSQRGAHLADELQEDPILTAAWPGSTQVGDPYSGCDEDDGFAYAGRTFDHPGSRDDLIAHYWVTATQHGWQPDSSESMSGAHCFTRQKGDLTIHLSMSFPDAFNIPGEPQAKPSEYTIELTASHDGTAWC